MHACMRGPTSPSSFLPCSDSPLTYTFCFCPPFTQVEAPGGTIVWSNATSGEVTVSAPGVRVVCLDGWMDRWINGWKDACMHAWMETRFHSAYASNSALRKRPSVRPLLRQVCKPDPQTNEQRCRVHTTQWWPTATTTRTTTTSISSSTSTNRDSASSSLLRGSQGDKATARGEWREREEGTVRVEAGESTTGAFDVIDWVDGWMDGWIALRGVWGGTRWVQINTLH